ncbi:MAG TPA: GNAT family N-acetyltransferase [Rhizomicrobium sp.]|jgi:phosphinothricin acetyltransferase|nr:GNAT family N-acetyltransferase [Rhizomicrobium sp.]
MDETTIRRAETRDVPALLEIYNYYVINTHVTFDLEPRTLDQRLAWFAIFGDAGRYQCFVAERGGDVIGWASSAPFKERAAYQTSVETSVYLAPDQLGRGIGLRLYGALFDALAGVDLRRAYGGISQPNEASVRLHERVGFRCVGAYSEVGRKFGRFWDVAVYERPCSKP